LLGARVDAERVSTERIEALVIGPELDSTQSELMDAPLDLLDHVTLVRVDRHESDQFLRVAAHELRGLLVDVAGPLHSRPYASGGHRATLEADTEYACAINRFNGAEVIVPADRGFDDAVGAPLCIRLTLFGWHGPNVRRYMRVDVDNHDRSGYPL